MQYYDVCVGVQIKSSSNETSVGHFFFQQTLKLDKMFSDLILK